METVEDRTVNGAAVETVSVAVERTRERLDGLTADGTATIVTSVAAMVAPAARTTLTRYQYLRFGVGSSGFLGLAMLLAGAIASIGEPMLTANVILMAIGVALVAIAAPIVRRIGASHDRLTADAIMPADHGGYRWGVDVFEGTLRTRLFRIENGQPGWPLWGHVSITEVSGERFRSETDADAYLEAVSTLLPPDEPLDDSTPSPDSSAERTAARLASRYHRSRALATETRPLLGTGE